MTTKVLNCRLNPFLAQKFSDIKSKTGYDSDAECVRYLINAFYFVFDNNKAQNLDKRMDKALEKLEKMIPEIINKKFAGKIPSLKEQRKRLNKKG